MKIKRASNRQRHRFAGVTIMRYVPTPHDLQRERDNEWARFSLLPHQRQALREMLNRVQLPLHEFHSSPTRIHDSFVEFQSSPRGLRAARPLIIQPLDKDRLDRFITTRLAKKRPAASGNPEFSISQFRFEPMQGDPAKGWSIVDEVPHKENDNGKAD